MDYVGKIKEKVRDGSLREMWCETKWMFTYIRRYRLAVFVHILLGMSGTVMSLLSSLAMKKLVDVVTGFDTGGIVSAACLMVGLMLGGIVMQALASRIAAIINIRVQNGIQLEVYDRMLRTDWAQIEKFRSGDLINRLNGDVNAVAAGVTSFLPSFVTGTVQFVGSFVIILCYDAVMALIVFIAAPLSVVLSRALVGKMREYNRRMKEISSQVMSFHEDSFRNLTSLKAFGIMDVFSARMRSIQEVYRKAFLEYNQFSVLVGALVSAIGLCVTVGCFGWGVYRLWTNAISFGTMTMFLQLTGMLRGAFSSLIGLVPLAISVTTSAGRLMAVIELPPEPGVDEAEEIPEGCTVKLENVSFGYASGEKVLENVDFEAHPGEFVAITGASGEGKTTMIRLMLGLIRPDEGRALLLSGDWETELSASTRRAFAYVPQGNTVMAGTIAENLRMVNESASDAELLQALELACALDFVSALPGGINSPAGEQGKGMSEGQAQRIAVARALLRHAPVLLMDEASSALDEQTERKMLDNIRSSGWVSTCIIISHRPAGAALCDRRYRLEGARLTAEKQ